MDYWFCVSVSLCVSVFSRERHNVQMSFMVDFRRLDVKDIVCYGKMDMCYSNISYDEMIRGLQ